MKKHLKVFIVAFSLIFITVLLGGCREEEKYNTAKNEFLKMQDEWGELRVNEENIDKDNELGKKLDAKLAEMETLAKSKTILNNDLIKVKEEYKARVLSRKAAAKAQDDVKQMKKYLEERDKK